MSRRRIAVIGLGAISQSVHLPLLARNGAQFETCALVDLSASRVADLATRHGVPEAGRFTSVDALCAAIGAGELAVDGAIVATTGSHAGDVLKLLKAGVRVLSEKPLSYSLAELDELTAWASERGVDLRRWVRVGYMKEYDLASRRAAALLADVKLRAVSVQVMHPVDGAQLDFARLAAAPSDVSAEQIAPFAAATAQVVDDAVGADLPTDLRTLYTNVVQGSIIHDVGLLRMLVGGLGEVTGAEHWGDAMPGSVHVRGRLAEHPVPFSIDWHYINDYPDYIETVTLHHEQGSIELIFGVPYVVNLPTVLRVTERRDGLGIAVTETTWMQQEAFETELVALAAMIDDQDPAGPSVAESAADIATGERIIAALAAQIGHSITAPAEAATA